MTFGSDFKTVDEFWGLWNAQTIRGFRELCSSYPSKHCQNCKDWLDCGGKPYRPIFKNMITFKYSFYYDLLWIFRTWENKNFLSQKKLVVFPPSIKNIIKIWFDRPDPVLIDSPFDITCYWISAGTWGSFMVPNKIFICPWNNKGGYWIMTT